MEIKFQRATKYEDILFRVTPLPNRDLRLNIVLCPHCASSFLPPPQTHPIKLV